MIVFVPIKENSQRVPRKNFRKIENTSLYLRLFEKLVDFKVYVDTDSEQIIKSLTDRYDNVTAYKREKRLEGDKVSVCDLIENLISKFKIKDKWICQVHVTSPFLSAETLNLVELMTKKEYDSIVSCNEVQTRFWRKESYGYCPVNHNPSKLEQTQDLPVYYEENSLFYAFNSEAFKVSKNRVGSNPYFMKTYFPENIDIDTEDDWNLVKSIAESNKT